MSLIIETDLGHDPDDLFAILWLIAAGIDISAIVITPGNPDQIRMAEFIRTETSTDFAIGAAKLGQTKLSSGSVHHALLNHYGWSLRGDDDVLLGVDVIREFRTSRADELLIIGPPFNVGAYLSAPYSYPFAHATMQGGCVPYSYYQPLVVLDPFLGKDWMSTFNLNGDRRGAERFLSAPFPRRMVGKNVCHTIVFEPQHQLSFFAPPPNRAAELFLEAGTFLGRDKKFHDPVAAVCHLRPEIGVWKTGKTVKRESGWTTVPGDDQVLVDLDRDAFWEYLYNWGGHDDRPRSPRYRRCPHRAVNEFLNLVALVELTIHWLREKVELLARSCIK